MADKTKTIQKPQWLAPFKRKFVEEGFAVTDSASIKQWFDRLMERECASAVELLEWLNDYSELMSIIGEDSNNRYIEMTCDTKDEKKTAAYLEFVRELQPKITEWSNALDRKYYDHPNRKDLDTAKYGRLDRMISSAIELYSEKNIPLSVKLAEQSQQYQTVTGGWTVEFEGKTQTMPQMSRYLFKTDRSVRESAWRAMTKRRLSDKEQLETLFDKMVATRHEFAQNLGLNDYREYCFKSKLRDYSPEDCLEFHKSIEKACVPLVRKITERRKQQMKVESLRPWDMYVDPLGRTPLEPFSAVDKLQDGVQKIFGDIDSRLGEWFGSIRENMDLDSRDGKAPGGYQTTYEERRVPFIFMNSAGVHSDVTTLLHEGGHAFHTLACRDNPMIWYRHASMEFSEVASMTQELFGNRYISRFYKDGELAKRAQLEQLERVVDIFPWVAAIDAFQHWIYTHPGHTREERAKNWLEISGRFEVELDWSDLDMDVKKYAWHRQLHLFEVPFYYIEYAIAQLGALQLYRVYQADKAKGIKQYLHGLAPGGSRSPHKLFEAAGIKFDFSLPMLTSLMEMVEQEMAALTAE